MPELYRSPGKSFTATTTAALTAGFAVAVDAAGDGQVRPAVAAEMVAGFVCSDQLLGDHVRVQNSGQVSVPGGAAITAGQLLMIDASSRPVPATPVAGEFIVGQALNSTASAGELVSFEINLFVF